MGQFLGMAIGEQDRVNDCVEMIGRFPLIGVRLITGAGEHRRRFVCGGFRIVYSLTAAGGGDDVTSEPRDQKEEILPRMWITIRRFARA
ncbi:MAG: hypothetical protein ACYDDR_13895 [Acidithiobacillus ferrivorans]